MPRYIEQLNENTTPAIGDWLWIVDVSAGATDQDRKLSVGKLALLAAENVFAETIRAQKGISFPVIQVESADAHRLDDYEEGVFDLAVAMSTSGTVTLDNETCRYTKIGRAITISGFITVTSVSSPVGTVQFTGLPYPSGGGWTAVSLQDNLSGKTKAYIPPSASYIEYSYFDDGVISAGMSPSWHCIILSTYTV